MAGEELLGLSSNDLIGFQNSVTQSDPYGLIGQSLASWQPQMQTWDPATQGITAFTKAFASGLLGNYARSRSADQLNSVIGVLPQLKSDPMSVVAPEGVDASPFAALKGIAVIKDAQKQAYLEERNDSRIGGLLNAVLPKLIENRKITAKEALTLASSEDPIAALDALNIAGASPAVTPAAPIDNPLANGKDSTLQKTQRYFQQFLDSGMPEVQAAAAAKEQVRGEIKANDKSFDDAKAAREYGQNLLSIANTARAGIGQAGETGKFNSVARGYEHVANFFGSSEAGKQLKGDNLLDSIGPDIIKLARPIGGGATSDFEARAYLGSGPSTSNTPEANLQLVRKMENLGKLNIEYADFIEAYKEANSGSVVGADKKWNDYKQAYPVFVGQGENIEVNNQRPSWQEYFADVGSGGSVPAGDKPQLTQEKYNQLRAQGLTKEQIKAQYGM